MTFGRIHTIIYTHTIESQSNANITILLTTILNHPSQITQSNIHTQHTIRYDETTHTAYTMMDSSMEYYDIPYILTQAFVFTSAPAASNTLTTST
jgi:hypothetical protein